LEACSHLRHSYVTEKHNSEWLLHQPTMIPQAGHGAKAHQKSTYLYVQQAPHLPTCWLLVLTQNAFAVEKSTTQQACRVSLQAAMLAHSALHRQCERKSTSGTIGRIAQQFSIRKGPGDVADGAKNNHSSTIRIGPVATSNICSSSVPHGPINALIYEGSNSIRQRVHLTHPM
jgi:hypothetical protein